MKIVLVSELGFTRTSAHVNLQAAGHAITEAEPTCLLDVLTVMRDILPHLVILDHDLPRCNCETTVRIIREDPVLGGTPILVLSDRRDPTSALRMCRWPQVASLEKPFQVETLLRRVHTQLHTFTAGS